VSHGTVKAESGTTCPPTTGGWYGKSGINYERLVQIKRRYDPGNIFRLNHNIDSAQ
jgi:FAD/FMN-containing dehydrogenase